MREAIHLLRAMPRAEFPIAIMLISGLPAMLIGAPLLHTVFGG